MSKWIMLTIAVAASVTSLMAQCPPVYTYTGEGINNYLGEVVAGGGDINGDGYGDIVIGASGYYGSGASKGRVYVYSGSDGDTLHVFTAGRNWFGHAVGIAGDVDNDGIRGNAESLVGQASPIDVCDLTYLLAYLFSGGPTPPPCQ